MSNLIEDYAIIGDCETATLVSRNGSIDWLCWPRFDSGAVFASILGDENNGSWSIKARCEEAKLTRKYRGNTLILETEVVTPDGAVTLIDFMPLRSGGRSDVVRLVVGRHGSVSMNTCLTIRFGYGSIIPWVTRFEGHSLKAIAGPDMVVLRSSEPMTAEGFRHHQEFTVRAGSTVSFVLSYGHSFKSVPPPIDPQQALLETESAWETWASTFKPSGGSYDETVRRSLITLKALTYRPTGGIVAAPTTSLPEQLGGLRNWDYRYCWLRDATFTLLALMDCGFEQEAEAWRTWLRHAVAGNPAQVQIMYGLAGERRLDEWEIPWLAGYEGTKPVRIGNAAANQLQLDIFGEVMDALFQGAIRGRQLWTSGWDLQCKLIEHLETIWRLPDEGIWEVRGGRRHFTHSKVMAWVAFDRAIKTVEQFGVEGPIERWREVREQIHREVCEQGYDEKIGSFVQSYGATDLDASTLLIPLVGFLPPSDPRVRSTAEAIEHNLMSNGLVCRYRTGSKLDGLPGDEGAFLACSCWLVDNLVLLGRHDEARVMFERILGLGNDVGLFSEEYDAKNHRMLGNFPQAFTHVAIITSALNLSKRDKPAEQRSGTMSAG